MNKGVLVLGSWVRGWLGLRPTVTGSTVELASGGRIRVFVERTGTFLEVTSPPDGDGRPHTAKVLLSVPEASEIQQVVEAARIQAAVTA
jgi:hypothetical protein